MLNTIHVEASIGAILANGKNYKVFELFKCEYVRDFESILKSENIYKSYCDYIRKNTIDEYVPVYNNTDIFDSSIVETRTINRADEYINALDSFLESHDGWEIRWFIYNKC